MAIKSAHSYEHTYTRTDILLRVCVCVYVEHPKNNTHEQVNLRFRCGVFMLAELGELMLSDRNYVVRAGAFFFCCVFRPIWAQQPECPSQLSGASSNAVTLSDRHVSLCIIICEFLCISLSLAPYRASGAMHISSPHTRLPATTPHKLHQHDRHDRPGIRTQLN